MSRSVCERQASTAPVSSWDFSQVYAQYREPIYKRIMALVSDQEEAAELTQETFLRAFKALSKMTGTLNMSAWLYRIATNVAYDALRRRKVIRFDPLDALSYEPCGAVLDDPQAFYNGPYELIRQAMERLPSSYQQALLLYIERQYTYAQIAEALHLAPKGIKMYLSRARRRLREQYALLEQEVANV